jgi:phosphoglycolate phosphatase
MRDGTLTLLFDLDGTLTDPRDGIVGSIVHALERLGAPVPESSALEPCIGPPLVDSFAELLDVPRDSAHVRQAIDHYRERFDAQGWRENHVYPGVPELLDAVRARGFGAVVATSKPTVFARRIVAHFGLEQRLDGVYGSELDGRLGRKPELVAHVLRCEALAAPTAVMIGDRRHDVEGARANGVASVGVLWGYGSRDELVSAGADSLCAEPGALLDVLAALADAGGSASR